VDYIAKPPALLAAGKQIDAALRESIETDYTKAQAELRDAERRATSHQRRVHEETRVIPHWKAYKRHSIETSTEPRDALNWMLDFLKFVQPVDDQPAQLAAMVIEVADAMDDPIDTDLRDIPIPDLLPIISGTLRLWNDDKDPSHRQRVIEISRDDFTMQRLESNVALLRGQETHLKKWVLSHQLEYALFGDADGQTLRAKGEAYKVYPGEDEVFQVDGISYELVKVYKSFDWYADYKLGASGGVKWPGVETTGRAFLMNDKDEMLAPRGEKLFSIKINNVYQEVKDTDTDTLAQVQYASAMYSILKAMGKLAKGLEKFAKVIMIAARYFPPTAAAARVAEIIGTVLQTVGSEDFKDIIAALGKEGLAAIRKHVENAIALLKPPDLPSLLLWLLFHVPNKAFDEFKIPDIGTSRQKKIGKRTGIWSRLASLVRNILFLGQRMLVRLHRLQDFVQAPVRKAHLFVTSHPGAALLVQLIVRNWERLTSIDFGELLGFGGTPSGSKDWKATVEEGVKEGATGIMERGVEMLNTLEHLELPDELVQVSTIIDWLLGTIINELGAEYKLGYDATKAILEELDVWQSAKKAIDDGIRESDMDPNELWRSLVKSQVNPVLMDLRDRFVAELREQLSAVPFLAKMVKDPVTDEKKTLSVTTAGSGFAEAEAAPNAELYAAPGGPSPFGALHAPPPSSFGSGAPLPAATRVGAELRLGNDLSHVRLHTGTAAAAMTQAYHAEGVTTGSHVFLRPGLSPGSEFGGHVLRHELAHVVQQTGPRPLGAVHSSAASLGTPSRGLNFDPMREAAAERAADAAPLDRHPIEAGGVRGVQPSWTDFFRSFFNKLTVTESLTEAMINVDKSKAASLEERFGTDARTHDLVTALTSGSQSVFAAIKGLTAKEFTMPPFKQQDSVVAPIRKFIVDNRKSDIEHAIPTLVSKARRTLETKEGDDEKKKTYHYVPPGALAEEMGDYLFPKTGLAISIVFNKEKGEGALKSKELVPAVKPIKSISAGYFHLPFIAANTDVWTGVIENTFANNPTIKTKYGSTKNALAEYKAGLRFVLSRVGLRPSTYDRKAAVLKLSDTFAKMVETEVHPPKDLPADALPAARDYLKTNHPSDGGTPVPPDGKFGHLGLRVGTYYQYGPDGPTASFEREAHHTTQYLLLEYFSNRHKSKKPFPLTGRIAANYYPGVVGDSSGVRTIAKRPGTSDVIQAAKYEKDRGGEMPVILLSAHAHHSDVHISPEPDDDKGKSSKSAQGNTVDNRFYEALGGRSWRDLFAKETLLKPLSQKKPIEIDGVLVTPDAMSERIYVAASRTYQYIWAEMKGKLEGNMPAKEAEYYNIVADLGSLDKLTHELKATDLGAPVATAVRWNEQLMGKSGAGFDPNA
jgi:hypothetical protein